MQGVLGYTAIGGRGHRAADGHHAHAALDPGRNAGGTASARAGSSSRGRCIMAGGLLWYTRLPTDSAPWQATLGDAGHAHPAGRRAHRRAARGPPVRARDRADRRAADEHAHELRADHALRARVRHQQLDLARRGAAHRRVDLHRDQRHVLFGARLADRARHRRSSDIRAGVPAAQPTARRRHRGCSSRPFARPRSTRSTRPCSCRPPCSASGAPCRTSGCAARRRQAEEPDPDATRLGCPRPTTASPTR